MDPLRKLELWNRWRHDERFAALSRIHAFLVCRFRSIDPLDDSGLGLCNEGLGFAKRVLASFSNEQHDTLDRESSYSSGLDR